MLFVNDTRIYYVSADFTFSTDRQFRSVIFASKEGKKTIIDLFFSLFYWHGFVFKLTATVFPDSVSNFVIL